MVPTARLLNRSPTTRTASGEAIDQKMACAAATMRRAPTSSANEGASAEATCPAANSTITATSRRFRLKRDANTMSGTESSATAHA